VLSLVITTLLISLGHPIYYNDDWYRPDELFPVENIFTTTVYNFHCLPHHFLKVGKNENTTIVSSLGGYCPRYSYCYVYHFPFINSRSDLNL
jgi:hypothetical protein